MNIATETSDQNLPMKQRDLRVDLLKTLGILCIILAHSAPNESFVFQIRNFDVPLMVMISGTLFYYSSRSKELKIGSYLRTRIPRLLAPVWLFVGFFFAAALILYPMLGRPYPFTIEDFVGSLRLVGGIDYLWIIRVFVLVAIAAPPLLKLYQHLQSEGRFLLVLLGIYTLYEGVYFLTETERVQFGFLENPVKNYVFYGVPFSCLYGLGMVLPNLDRRRLSQIALVALAVFLGMAAVSFQRFDSLISTQELKYPPTLYYLSYGVFASILLFAIVTRFVRRNSASLQNSVWLPWITFLSESTLWIYLWHVFFLHYWVLLAPQMFDSPAFGLIFLGLAGLSIAATFLQKRLFHWMITNTRFGQTHAQWLTILFLK